MTEINYEGYAKMFKAVSDPKRLQILFMLSGGELCACRILEQFRITQPTLSHDMKVLCDAGLVSSRKEGKWNHYTLNQAGLNKMQSALAAMTADSKTDNGQKGGC